MDRERLTNDLMQQEGRKVNRAGRHVVYDDSLHIPTIGYGRNVRDVGLSEGEARLLLANDIVEREIALTHALPWFTGLDDVRQRVLVDMAFMGVDRLLAFRRMLDAVEAGDYARAAVEMLDSRWAAQVGTRAVELAAMMRTGLDP